MFEREKMQLLRMKLNHVRLKFNIYLAFTFYIRCYSFNKKCKLIKDCSFTFDILIQIFLRNSESTLIQ